MIGFSRETSRESGIIFLCSNLGIGKAGLVTVQYLNKLNNKRCHNAKVRVQIRFITSYFELKLPTFPLSQIFLMLLMP